MAKKTTTARKTTARKTATKPAAEADLTDTADAAVEAATADAAVEASADAGPAVENAVQPVTEITAEKMLGKRELIDRVVTASGIKKSAAKPVIEAMLLELGNALSQGETLNLQPFGKGIVKNRKELENAEVIELRLRRSKQAIEAAEPSVSDPLAEAAE